MVFQEIEFLSFPYSGNLKDQIVVLAFQIDAIFTFWIFFFWRPGCQWLKNRVGFSSIRLRSKVIELFSNGEKKIEEPTHGNGISRNKILEVSNSPT